MPSASPSTQQPPPPPPTQPYDAITYPSKISIPRPTLLPPPGHPLPNDLQDELTSFLLNTRTIAKLRTALDDICKRDKDEETPATDVSSGRGGGGSDVGGRGQSGSGSGLKRGKSNGWEDRVRGRTWELLRLKDGKKKEENGEDRDGDEDDGEEEEEGGSKIYNQIMNEILQNVGEQTTNINEHDHDSNNDDHTHPNPRKRRRPSNPNTELKSNDSNNKRTKPTLPAESSESPQPSKSTLPSPLDDHNKAHKTRISFPKAAQEEARTIIRDALRDARLPPPAAAGEGGGYVVQVREEVTDGWIV